MDLIRMAMEEAARQYVGPFTNGTFSYANFSRAMCSLCLSTSPLGRRTVREILQERDDVLFTGLRYYQIKNYTSMPKASDIAVEEDE